MSILSRYIKDILDREGMSQNELARVSGVGQGYVSEIVKGNKVPSKKILDKLLPYLHTTREELHRMAGYSDPTMPSELPEGKEDELYRAAYRMREEADKILEILKHNRK